MGFRQELRICSGKLLTVYDLVSFCYDYLIKNIKDQAHFLGKYVMENEKAQSVNPNLPGLRELNKQVKGILQQREELGIPFPECLGEVLEYLRGFCLEEYGEALLNDATIPFFLLMSIDRYVKGNDGRCYDIAPLNKEYCENSYIYRNTQKNMLDDAAEENNYSDVIRQSLICNQMENLIILEKKDLPDNVDPPRVITLWLDDIDDKKMEILAGKKLKIAVIPYGEGDMLDFPIDYGALFHVEYKEQHLITGPGRIEKLLELAVEMNANVIVLPEFVCDQKIQSTIQKWLKDQYEKKPEKMSSLLFVVAGSGWIDGNNISYIYSYSGRLIGKQYKKCGFSDLKHEGQKMIENLRNPGQETTILDVDGIGKILIGICRDIVERDYTKKLARAFRPQFLLVPAWSTSVNKGFKKQFQEIVEENHRTCSILCNCCAAFRNMKKIKKEVGLVVTPYKKGSVIEGKVNMICRSEKCIPKCKDGGCLFLLEMDFSYESVKKGQMISNMLQFTA